MTKEYHLDPDKPASEQFDLGGDAPDIAADGIAAMARELERVVEVDVDASDYDDDTLADLVSALKRLEDAAEDARKETYESALSERVDVGESVGDVTRYEGSRRYVTDDGAAFDAVLDAGIDPREVAKINVGDLEDALGRDAERFLGESKYEYFRRDR